MRPRSLAMPAPYLTGNNALIGRFHSLCSFVRPTLPATEDHEIGRAVQPEIRRTAAGPMLPFFDRAGERAGGRQPMPRKPKLRHP
jgi:hypothetical protein